MQAESTGYQGLRPGAATTRKQAVKPPPTATAGGCQVIELAGKTPGRVCLLSISMTAIWIWGMCPGLALFSSGAGSGHQNDDSGRVRGQDGAKSSTIRASPVSDRPERMRREQ